MILSDFLARLDGVKQITGELAKSQFAAKCPAHADDSASLVLTDEGDKWLIFCHAGCAYGSIMLAAGAKPGDNLCVGGVEKAGGVVNIGSVRPAQSSKQAARPTGGTSESRVQMPPAAAVESWQRDLSGGLVERLADLKGWSERTLRTVGAGWDGARVVFPVYAPGPRLVALVRYLPGGRPKSMAVGPRELWPAPELLPDGDAWLVEGEPDRVSAVELGLNAVSVPGVATWKPGWAERFRGRRVTVCLDCDPQGREATAMRVMQLMEAGVDARGVDLFPSRTDGYDLGDALLGATQDGRVNDLRRYLMRLEATAWESRAAA